MNRTPLLAAALALSAAAAAMAAGPLDAALDAYKKGDYAKASELAASVEKTDALRPRAAYLLGEASLALAKWEEAEKAFREVLEKKANNVPALVGLGRAQTGAGAEDAAVATLEKAVKLDVKDAVARRSLGEARLAKGDADKARADLEQAVKLDPKDPFASRSLVEACFKSEKMESAAREADRLAKALPDSPMGPFLKALVLDREGKHKDAIETYEKAIAKDDKFLDAHKNLAILCIAQSNTYSDTERVKKAFVHFERYFALGGQDTELKQVYATIKGFLEQNGFK